MHSLTMHENQLEEIIHNKTIQSLLGAHDIQLIEQKSGGNSKVFCIAANGEKWAVKYYPPYAPGKRDRLKAEYMAYQFLNAAHIQSVPHLKGASDEARFLMMSWIDGEKIHEPTATDVTLALNFIDAIANARHSPPAKTLPQAAEACLSLKSLLSQIENRFENLQSHAKDQPSLQQFLIQEFLPLFKTSASEACAHYQKNHMAIEGILDQAHQALIPADFGFHNALRDETKALYFFDFDYFGWDDPVKLLADILWHPKMNLDEAIKKTFIDGISKIYAKDGLFSARFTYTYQLFGLRWVLILLNEFIPAFWQNRSFAKTHQQFKDPTAIKANQLELAKKLLQQCSRITL